jgi:hypothetical protein
MKNLGISSIFDANATTGHFTHLRKVTFGEMINNLSTGGFRNQPLDTIIFLGRSVVRAGSSPYFEGLRVFSKCPNATKIIVPCGMLEIFLASFALDAIRWQDPVTWTSANFVEAECLNTLTVLSSDVSMGNSRSYSTGGSLITSTPSNTSSTFSGTAELIAIAKSGKVFVGWSDDNQDNPRVVTVSSDTTFTAKFAECKETKVLKHEDESSFRVYPNPTNGTLKVELEKEVTNGVLTLFDVNGKVVLSQSVNGKVSQLNLSSLSAGNYILRLVENGKSSAGVQVVKN